jgi:hypothetical protein
VSSDVARRELPIEVSAAPDAAPLAPPDQGGEFIVGSAVPDRIATKVEARNRGVIDHADDRRAPEWAGDSGSSHPWRTTRAVDRGKVQ